MEFLHGRDEQKSARRISGLRVDPFCEGKEGADYLIGYTANFANCSPYDIVEAKEDSVLLYIPEYNFIIPK